MTTLTQTGRKEQGEKSETKRGRKKEREREPESWREKTKRYKKSKLHKKQGNHLSVQAFLAMMFFPCPWSFKIHRDPSHTSFRNMRCSFQTEDELTKAGWQQNTQHGTATLQSYIVRTDILQSDLTNTFTMQTMPHFFQVEKE